MNKPLLWLAAALPLLLSRAALPGLADPSEARYGQICREMAEGRDWLVPTWQGIPHLEKPPLAYWAGALGIRLLGKTELAVRLGALSALILSAFCVAGIARRIVGPEAAAPAALGMLLSPLTVAAGAACLTDPFLLAATALFFHSVVRRLRDEDPRALDIAALALALGILAKGHMVFLFTVVPFALARTGVFRELWRPRRIALLLALTVPWFAVIEIRYPGFVRYQIAAVGGRAMGSGHIAPFFIYGLVLAAGLFPFVACAPRGFAGLFPMERPRDVAGLLRALRDLFTKGSPDRRLLLLWLLVPLVVLSAARSRLWTYILPAAPPLLIFAAARLGSASAAAARWPKWVLAAGGATCLLLSGIDRPLGQLGIALLAGALWLLAARRLPRAVAVAGVSAILVGAAIAGACLHEDLFDVHRRFARDVAALSARTGGPIVVAGMSLPSIGFYADGPVTIAGESSRLALEAEAWGRSPLFVPETDVARLLAEDVTSVIVLKEQTLASLAPKRIPVARAMGLVAVWGPPQESGPLPPPR